MENTKNQKERINQLIKSAVELTKGLCLKSNHFKVKHYRCRFRKDDDDDLVLLSHNNGTTYIFLAREHETEPNTMSIEDWLDENITTEEEFLQIEKFLIELL